MTRDEALKLLGGGRKGIVEWNSRRESGEAIPPLHRADLHKAQLRGAELWGAELDHANLRDADLTAANLTDSDLSNAILRGALLFGTYFNRCVLTATKFAGTNWGWTTLANVDLREAKGLDTAKFMGRSSIGVDTMVLSKGQIPESFLYGCGFQPWQILEAGLYDPSLTRTQITDLQCKILDARTTGPIFRGIVFITYSHSDTAFVDKVDKRLTGDGVTVYRDVKDLEAGPIVPQLSMAIDRSRAVLLVLSKHSIDSDWVAFEMSRAREQEKRSNRYLLCPVSLDDAWKKKTGPIWQYLKDSYFILDFSKWETSAFDAEYKKLLNGMKKWYQPPKEDKATQATSAT